MLPIEYTCDICSAIPGEECQDQTTSGFTRLLPWYHTARVDAAFADITRQVDLLRALIASTGP